MKPTKKAVLAALRKLGKTPDAIAASLRRRKIRGGRGMETCPLAVYLAKQGWDASVGSLAVAVYDSNGHSICESPLPVAHQDFVERHDDGQYPFLQLKGDA